MILDDVTLYEAIVHFMCIGWKCVFAFVPPPHMGGGIPSLLIALTFIGIITAIVAEVATILGCVINLKGAVTAITLVAMGTSLPDTFASITAARTSEYADSAVGMSLVPTVSTSSWDLDSHGLSQPTITNLCFKETSQCHQETWVSQSCFS